MKNETNYAKQDKIKLKSILKANKKSNGLYYYIIHMKNETNYAKQDKIKLKSIESK